MPPLRKRPARRPPLLGEPPGHPDQAVPRQQSCPWMPWVAAKRPFAPASRRNNRRTAKRREQGGGSYSQTTSEAVSILGCKTIATNRFTPTKLRNRHPASLLWRGFYPVFAKNRFRRMDPPRQAPPLNAGRQSSATGSGCWRTATGRPRVSTSPYSQASFQEWARTTCHLGRRPARWVG